ncbi:MAG TPA: prolyl oligopeptidase family serine peptidase [Acidimicrobiales bacterium]|nr:prolyl oligopeptidase family serine peptidase [Acidimicrobiales bacterium]
MSYPPAPRDQHVEVLFGHEVADPYRWLEDAAAPETVLWSRAQDALFASVVAALPDRDAWRDRLRALVPGSVELPSVVGGRTFLLRRRPDQEHPVYLVVEPGGEERALIDPAALDPTLTTTLDLVRPSKDGRLVAYVLSEGGREDGVLRVMDVASGEVVDGPVHLGRGPDVAWLAGGEELLYVGRLPDGRVPPGEEQFHRRVWRRRLGTDPAHDRVLFGEGADTTAYFGLHTSRDGRWLTVTVALGTAPRNDVHLCDLAAEGEPVFRPVQEGVDAQTFAWVGHDGRLYLLTDRDAPRWRLCVTDPAGPVADASAWADLLAEDDDDVLTDVAVTDDAVVAVRSHDVVSRVSVHDRLTGARRGDVVLPGLGAASVTSRPDGGDEVWIGYSDHVTPQRVLHHRVGSGEVTVWAEPPGAPDTGGITVEQVFYRSRDGTRVPMFVIAAPAAHAGPRPTILYGYGGFDIALTPAYSSSILAWVQAGGVYAVANLRGGSEYGEAWHRAGMREHKQNVFDDFSAAAEWLVAEGRTEAGCLAASGGSNGGLLVGAALTQRPELFRAVACSAPLLDMVRYERFGLGRTWNDEYGRADDPVELGWLLSYSPYHRVREGTRYPAVLFTVFEGDTRVDPLHARKLCAAVQHATSASPEERPVLIRAESDVGHSSRAVTRTVELQADTLAFLASQLGLPAPTS